ncbi:NAD(P)-dependent oxidoreductase [Mesorhizobium sp. SARCC-RB16n]|uniref:SDR family oxidoreductase n=1 Tax=Mesorhizobium sp. SARCC-RB16n TaxID=2116687 RepID=UPI00122F43E1|nr:SDR family oxidoreductase [Mesorhizobium sp. SARCC-RB16n]KAA3452407.1 NAD(P)-dependent oxidoreductase [Mesorhizobium sp. SARCC-RB16n]
MILVTGATGLNGKAIVREFARQKHQMRALVRDLGRASAAGLGGLAGVELIEGDMRRAETLGAALDGIDRVLMISTAAQDMVETQCRFIDACKQAGVAHVVKFSGAESNIGYDATRFRFTRMHEEVERYLEGAGMAWTHLRPSQFMQVYLRDAPTIATEGAFYLALGDTELSPVDVEDIAKVAVRLLRDGGHEGESLDMTGPEALTMSDIAARISQGIAKPVRYVDISPRERRRNLLAAGVPADFADALDEQLAERRRRPKSRVHLATHEMFGVRPTPFVEFARRHAAMFGG